DGIGDRSDAHLDVEVAGDRAVHKASLIRGAPDVTGAGDVVRAAGRDCRGAAGLGAAQVHRAVGVRPDLIGRRRAGFIADLIDGGDAIVAGLPGRRALIGVGRGGDRRGVQPGERAGGGGAAVNVI